MNVRPRAVQKIARLTLELLRIERLPGDRLYRSYPSMCYHTEKLVLYALSLIRKAALLRVYSAAFLLLNTESG